MKKFLSISSCILFVFFILSYSACKRNNSNPEGEWSDEDQRSYEDVISLQDQIAQDLESWFQTMDSTDAVEMAFQTFQNNEHVSSAYLSSQGIAVQYANGIRGGILLQPKDYPALYNQPLAPENHSEKVEYKSIVNKRGYLLINPHYYEREIYSDYIWMNTFDYFQKIDLGYSTFLQNHHTTLDKFASLSDYGIVHIYSHGYAWPNENNITEVFLLTGETSNNTTTKKYWEDIKGGNIPILVTGSQSGKYYVSPEFIKRHNDFSNDTTLLYGGFCYSFLGSWPDLVDEFAQGAYFGYDWSVRTNKNAEWAVSLFFYLCDTTKESPYTVENWMNNPDHPKYYWDEGDQRNLTLHYSGDATLRLWNSSSVSLNATSSDGAPVSVPGEVNVWYPFKCTAIVGYPDLLYTWDLGDGTDPVTTQSGEVEIYWDQEGTFQLKVDVHKDAGIPDTYVGSASLTVTIGTSQGDIVNYLKSCLRTGMTLESGLAITDWGYTSVYWMTEGGITWDGLNFSAVTQHSPTNIHSLDGSVSSDGQTISYTFIKERQYDDMDVRFALTLEDYPLFKFEPENAGAVYKVDPPEHSYVTNFEGYIKSDEFDDVYLSTNDIDWSKVTLLEMIIQHYELPESGNRERVRRFTSEK